MRAAVLGLGPHGDDFGFGDILAGVKPHDPDGKEATLIQADVHAPPEGAFAAALDMIEFYVENLGVRGAVAMGEPSWQAWSGAVARWARLAGVRSAVLRDRVETPLGSIEFDWTAALLPIGAVSAAHTGHAVTLNAKNHKAQFVAAVDLVSLLAGAPLPTPQLAELALAAKTFRGYLNHESVAQADRMHVCVHKDGEGVRDCACKHEDDCDCFDHVHLQASVSSGASPRAFAGSPCYYII
jgi:hypothetical protein